jgi:hypothetical protein
MVTNERSLFILLQQFLFSNTQGLVFFGMILNLILDSSVLSALPVLLLFCYALLEDPRSPKGCWKFVQAYYVIVVALKCMFQLDLFCLDYSNVYTITPAKCLPDDETIVFQGSRREFRLDKVLGIYKYGGSIALFILCEFFILILITWRRWAMRLKGVWDLTVNDHPLSLVSKYFKTYQNHLAHHHESSSSFHSHAHNCFS